MACARTEEENEDSRRGRTVLGTNTIGIWMEGIHKQHGNRNRTEAGRRIRCFVVAVSLTRRTLRPGTSILARTMGQSGEADGRPRRVRGRHGAGITHTTPSTGMRRKCNSCMYVRMYVCMCNRCALTTIEPSPCPPDPARPPLPSHSFAHP